MLIVGKTSLVDVVYLHEVSKNCSQNVEWLRFQIAIDPPCSQQAVWTDGHCSRQRTMRQCVQPLCEPAHASSIHLRPPEWRFLRWSGPKSGKIPVDFKIPAGVSGLQTILGKIVCINVVDRLGHHTEYWNIDFSVTTEISESKSENIEY